MKKKIKVITSKAGKFIVRLTHSTQQQRCVLDSPHHCVTAFFSYPQPEDVLDALPCVVVCLGCRNKVPQTRQHLNIRNVFSHNSGGPVSKI